MDVYIGTSDWIENRFGVMKNFNFFSTEGT